MGETERDPDFVRERKCVLEEEAVWNILKPVSLNVTIMEAKHTHTQRKGVKI